MRRNSIRKLNRRRARAEDRARARVLASRLRAGAEALVPVEVTSEGWVEIGPPRAAPVDAERLARWLLEGKLVARPHPSRERWDYYQLALAPPRRRLTREERAIIVDLLMFASGQAGVYGPDGRRIRIGPRGDPVRWQQELLRDAFNARTPETIRELRRRWGLHVTAAQLAEFQTVMERTGVFRTPRPGKFGPDLRARYSVRRVRWGGVAGLYAVLSRALDINPTRNEDARPEAGAGTRTVILEQRSGRAPAAVAPAGALCSRRQEGCQGAFMPRGSVRDCCPNPACRRARRNAARRTWYAEHREQEIQRVMRAQRPARRRGQAGSAGLKRGRHDGRFRRTR